MPNSPKVSFNLINNNLEATKPLNGVSCMLARTTSGPVGLGETLINSVTKFRSIYGSEIVPDGSPSNIEKALKGGSKLRIIRVVGSGATENFVATTANAQTPDTIFNISLKDGSIGETAQILQFAFKAKNNPAEFKGKNPLVKVQTDANGNIFVITYEGNTVFEKALLLNINKTTTTVGQDTVNYLSLDASALNTFIQSNRYWDIYWMSSSTVLTGWGVPTSLTKGGDFMVNLLKEHLDGLNMAGEDPMVVTVNQKAAATSVMLTVATTGITVGTGNPMEAYVIAGNPGSTPTAQQWEDAAESIRDLQEIYEVSCSHLNQHLSNADELQVHAYIGNMADEMEEFQYFVEIPVTESTTKAQLIALANQYEGAIGKSKWICYFTAGIKYYSENGNLVASNVMGTVHGLADACASNYGPYRSFAGLNRGVIADGNGPVIQNYGTPSRYDDLNDLANACLNVIVLKQTRTAGLATVLWHSFTSQVRQDSFRFINAVRLALYIKKQIRPILESYIEEPNMWNSWKRIYLEAKPIMDGLVTDDAITEYTWEGDQDATSWDELTVNNEADARNGKYKLNIKVKDVATMQDIQVNLVYDQASNTMSSSITTV